MSTISSTKGTLTTRVSEASSLLAKTMGSPPEAGMRLNKCWNNKRKIQVDILASLFGISAWLSINAMFTQLPILVQSAPEGWNLPSYLSILIQIANIGPILYSLSQRYCPTLIPDSKLIYFMLFLGSSSLILMALYYDDTWVVAGESHSVVLFIFAFCIALVGCTSSVLFIPFMNNYPEEYLMSYMVGEGLSGFVPSIVSLVQGVGGNPSCVNSTTPTGEIILVPHTPPPLFSPEVFFFIMFSIMAVSTIAFFLLNNLSSCKKQRVRKHSIRKRSNSDHPAHDLYLEPEPFVPTTVSAVTLTPTMYKVFLIIQTIVSMFAHGALPSVQSYSCLPYGNLAYHFAVNLGNMANPVACFLAYFVPHTAPAWIFSLFFMSGIAVSYVLTTAFLSPSPPLQNSHFGIIIIVLSWAMCSGLISYVKMSLASLFRREGGNGLFWYGAMTQLGSAIGSAVMFYLINHAHVFTSYNACHR